MTEPRPKGGEASRRPPEPRQLGEIRDLIKELAPTNQEVKNGKRSGRALPNMRSRGFTGQDGTFFHVLVTSHELIPRADNPKTFGFINVLNYDSGDRNTLFSQCHFHLDVEGDPGDDENLRLRRRETPGSFDERSYRESNTAFFGFGIDDGFMSADFSRNFIDMIESQQIGRELRADGANAEQAQDLIDTLILARDTGTIIE